jgi:hypothetical protein
VTTAAAAAKCICAALRQLEHHLLPVETKVEALEYLCEALLDCDWFQQEMDYRGRTDRTVLDLDEDGSVMACVLCDLGGSIVCCDVCPRAYHIRCIGGKHGTDIDTWHCFECRGNLPDPSVYGCRVEQAAVPGSGRGGVVWVVGGFAFRASATVVPQPAPTRKGWRGRAAAAASVKETPGPVDMELMTPQEVFVMGQRLGREAAQQQPFTLLDFPEHCWSTPLPPSSDTEPEADSCYELSDDGSEVSSSCLHCSSFMTNWQQSCSYCPVTTCSSLVRSANKASYVSLYK